MFRFFKLQTRYLRLLLIFLFLKFCIFVLFYYSFEEETKGEKKNCMVALQKSGWVECNVVKKNTQRKKNEGICIQTK